MWFLYGLAIRTYVFLILIASLWNEKARLWHRGRKNVWYRLKAAIPFDKPVVWFHAASLGEFEQGRPVIERFRSEHPNSFILLTFFSPSGYEIQKNYPHADYVCYLPADTITNARRFIHITHPEIAFFIKYEFWFNYLRVLSRSEARVVLISGIFRPTQHFFRSYGAWFRRQLHAFSYFFVQDEASAQLLKSIGISQVKIIGDTRFDRVSEICEKTQGNHLVAAFTTGHKVVVAGSTWKEDEIRLKKVLDEMPEIKLVLAPHEVGQSHIMEIEQLFKGQCLRLSEAEESGLSDARVLIIDSIGLLSALYRYAGVAYIGGGFGKGIHNILEAACYSVPVVFGPNYHRFREAHDLVQAGGAFSFQSPTELKELFHRLFYAQYSDNSPGAICGHYVGRHKGATNAIADWLKGKISDREEVALQAVHGFQEWIADAP